MSAMHEKARYFSVLARTACAEGGYSTCQAQESCVLNRLGIRSRVLLLALLPAGLMALVLGSYFTWLQQNELQTQLLQRGKMIAEHLASTLR